MEDFVNGNKRNQLETEQNARLVMDSLSGDVFRVHVFSSEDAFSVISGMNNVERDIWAPKTCLMSYKWSKSIQERLSTSGGLIKRELIGSEQKFFAKNWEK